MIPSIQFELNSLCIVSVIAGDRAIINLQMNIPISEQCCDFFYFSDLCQQRGHVISLVLLQIC